MRLSFIIGLLILALVPISHAQTADEQWLTVIALQARVGESPFLADDFVVDVFEVNVDAPPTTPVLSLWGANAIAYPNQITTLAWSPSGREVAWVMTDRNGGEALAIYDPGAQQLTEILPASAGYTQLQSLNWTADGGYLIFSATDSDQISLVIQILAVPDAVPEVLFPGRLPVLDASGRIIYFSPLDQVSLWDDGDITYLRQTTFSQSAHQPTLSPDQQTLAFVVDARVLTLALESERVQQIWDAALDFPDQVDVRIDALYWAESRLFAIVNASDQSQVVSFDPLTNQVVTLMAYSADLPYQFLTLAPQNRGVFLPEREDASGSDL